MATQVVTKSPIHDIVDDLETIDSVKNYVIDELREHSEISEEDIGRAVTNAFEKFKSTELVYQLDHGWRPTKYNNLEVHETFKFRIPRKRGYTKLTPDCWNEGSVRIWDGQKSQNALKIFLEVFGDMTPEYLDEHNVSLKNWDRESDVSIDDLIIRPKIETIECFEMNLITGNIKTTNSRTHVDEHMLSGVHRSQRATITHRVNTGLNQRGFFRSQFHVLIKDMNKMYNKKRICIYAIFDKKSSNTQWFTSMRELEEYFKPKYYVDAEYLIDKFGVIRKTFPNGGFLKVVDYDARDIEIHLLCRIGSNKDRNPYCINENLTMEEEDGE